MNKIYPCVANFLVNELQQYTLFCVDYFKLSYIDTKLNKSFIAVLREEYQTIFEDGSSTMQVKCGKVHKYLGMKLYYSAVSQLKITLLDYN